MTPRNGLLSRLLMLAFLGALALLLTGCGVDVPQNTFAPEGDVAREQRDLFYLVMWPAIAIFVVVEGVLLIAILRFRRRGDERLPKQVHGNTRLEVAWTLAPAALMLGLVAPMVVSIADLARDPDADAMPVNVIGQRFSWSFEYPGLEDAEGEPLFTLGELHIPVDTQIAATLESVDVIHSFWVPRLAGKLDVVPGRANRMWFNATEPGAYSGQCAEFCGLEHYKMRLCIIVHESEEDFLAWAETAKSGSGQPQPTSCGGGGSLG